MSKIATGIVIFRCFYEISIEWYQTSRYVYYAWSTTLLRISVYQRAKKL